MSTVKTENKKIYNECGFNLDDCNPYYGHLEKGTRALEIIEGERAANYALMLLCSIEGIDFAKVIVESAETIEYLQFWAESDQFLTPFGQSPGLVLVAILLLTRRYGGTEALTESFYLHIPGNST